MCCCCCLKKCMSLLNFDIREALVSLSWEADADWFLLSWREPLEIAPPHWYYLVFKCLLIVAGNKVLKLLRLWRQTTPCHRLHRVTDCTVSQTTPCHRLHRVTDCTVSHTTPCRTQHRVTDCTVSQTAPCHTLHRVTDYTVSQTTPCHTLHRVAHNTVSHTTPCHRLHRVIVCSPSLNQLHDSSYVFTPSEASGIKTMHTTSFLFKLVRVHCSACTPALNYRATIHHMHHMSKACFKLVRVRLSAVPSSPCQDKAKMSMYVCIHACIYVYVLP